MSEQMQSAARRFLVHFSNCEGDYANWTCYAENEEEAKAKVMREIDETIRIEDVEEITER